MNSYDVVLIGGGIAGLMSAYKLCNIGLSVALVENKPVFAAGPSTRNEGWLHKGTYHATSINNRQEAVQVAKRCIYGHEYIREFAPEALEDIDKRPLALLKDESRVDEVISRWNEAGVSFTPLTLSKARSLVPEADFTETKAIFAVDDVSLNTRLLYRKLISAAQKAGCVFYLGHEITAIEGQTLHLESLSGDKAAIAGQRIVYSSGTGARDLFTRHHDLAIPIRYWKSHLIITPRLCAEGVFYLDPHQAAMMHHGDHSIVGFNEDALLSPCADYEVIHERAENIKRGIASIFPGWDSRNSASIACVKVDLQTSLNCNRSLNVAIAEPVPGHILALPGKMTEAPFLTDKLVAYLHDAIDNASVAMRPCDEFRVLEKIA